MSTWNGDEIFWIKLACWVCPGAESHDAGQHQLLYFKFEGGWDPKIESCYRRSSTGSSNTAMDKWGSGVWFWSNRNSQPNLSAPHKWPMLLTAVLASPLDIGYLSLQILLLMSSFTSTTGTVSLRIVYMNDHILITLWSVSQDDRTVPSNLAWGADLLGASYVQDQMMSHSEFIYVCLAWLMHRSHLL